MLREMKVYTNRREAVYSVGLWAKWVGDVIVDEHCGRGRDREEEYSLLIVTYDRTSMTYR